MNSSVCYERTARVFGKKRYFKEIERNEIEGLLDGSPLEVLNVSSVYDVETFEYFLCIGFARVCERLISSFDIHVDLFLESSIPYKKIDFTYNIRKKDIKKAYIGENVYIPIPESYFKDYEIGIKKVVWDSGEETVLNLSCVQREGKAKKEKYISEMDLEVTPLYKSEKYPAKFLPEFRKEVWVCTCGQKNLEAADECVRCTRTKESQRLLLSERNTHERAALVTRAKRADFESARNPEKEDKGKEELIEKEIAKVAKREKFKDKMKTQALPRLLAYIVIAYLIYLLLAWFNNVR